MPFAHGLPTPTTCELRRHRRVDREQRDFQAIELLRYLLRQVELEEYEIPKLEPVSIQTGDTA